MRSIVLATGLALATVTTGMAGVMPAETAPPSTETMEFLQTDQTIEAPGEQSPIDQLLQFIFTALFLVV